MTMISVLLRLYPKQFRDEFAVEMLATYYEGAREHRLHGHFAYMFFAGRELAGLTLGLLTEWTASLLAELRINRERWAFAAHNLTACSLALALHALFYGHLLPIGGAALASASARSVLISVYGVSLAISLELCRVALERAIKPEDE